MRAAIIRAAVPLIAVPALLAGCAADVPAPSPSSTPTTSSAASADRTPTPTPTPSPRNDVAPATWAGADCESFTPTATVAAALESDATRSPLPPQHPAEATLLQNGALSCTWTSPDEDSGFFFDVMAGGTETGRAQLDVRDNAPLSRYADGAATVCGLTGDAGWSSQCVTDVVSGDLWAEMTLWSNTGGRNETFLDASAELERSMRAALQTASPASGWDAPSSVWRIAACEELDADGAVAAAVAIDDLRFHHRSRGAGDAMSRAAWDATGYLLCNSRGLQASDSAGYGPTAEILPGGAWAFHGLRTNSDWRAERIRVDGADDAVVRCRPSTDICVLDAMADGNWIEVYSINDRLTRDQLTAALSALLADLSAI